MIIPKTFRGTAWLIGFAGLLLFVLVIGFQGVGAISRAVAAAGWGLVWVALFHSVPMVIDAYGWQRLLDSDRRRGLCAMSWMRWIGEAANNLLPVAQIGGNLVRARLLSLAGVPASYSGASVVVDVTAGVVSQIVFALIGVMFLLDYSFPGYSIAKLLFGLVPAGLIIYGFYIAQRRGLFLVLARGIERLTGTPGDDTLSNHAQQLDQVVDEIYRRRRNFLLVCLVRLLGWITGAGEVWLALYFLGHPVTPGEALMLESLGQAIRSAAFAVPGALGVQEGGYLLLGTGMGIAPEIAVALSLVKRVRELLLGVPALLVWQWIEAHRRRDRAVDHEIAAGK